MPSEFVLEWLFVASVLRSAVYWHAHYWLRDGFVAHPMGPVAEGSKYLLELGMWDRPHLETWINNLGHAVQQADRPIIFAAHSLGCAAVAWWAALETPETIGRVSGALLVAPPDLDMRPLDARLSGFAPLPQQKLPFPSILVGSHDDPYATLARSRSMAQQWGARFAEAGRAGHINAQSNLSDWPFGRFLLQRLMDKGPACLDNKRPLYQGSRSSGQSH